VWGCQSAWELCWFIPRVAQGIPHEGWCSRVGLLNVFQAGLEPVSGGKWTFLFSQCNTAWRSFVRARGSGCRSFDFSWCFISAKCGSSVSARFFYLQSSCCLLLYPSHYLGSLNTILINFYLVLKSLLKYSKEREFNRNICQRERGIVIFIWTYVYCIVVNIK
jgi:hypothetical protein